MFKNNSEMDKERIEKRMKTKGNDWMIGYKEFKNYLHNEEGLTKAHIHEIIEKTAREEVKDALGKNGEFIRLAIREVIREEMIVAISEKKYPKVSRNVWNYTEESKTPFSEFISSVIKEEMVEVLRNQFNVAISIESKSNT